MTLPKFLLGDNTDFPDDIFIIHTEYPQFIINLVDDEIEWLEDLSGENEAELTSEVNDLIELASQFYDREMERYND
ncbi:MAG: hypothetical protein L3J20_00470 [Flavobacteriaceae bacterium]|nr:hypothetical protein [Flavobacteriaceae bacterium]